MRALPGASCAETPVSVEGEYIANAGAAPGTLPYMSPEQVRGEELHERSDLFSFGTVLYEMATGSLAFPAATPGVVFEAILNRAPISLLRLAPSTPAELGRIIEKALEKDRDLRYQHASEMRADLTRLKREADPKQISVTAVAPVLQNSGVIVTGSSAHVQALEQGRESFRKRAWADAFSNLSSADQEAPLDPEHLVELAQAALLIGKEVEGSGSSRARACSF